MSRILQALRQAQQDFTLPLPGSSSTVRPQPNAPVTGDAGSVVVPTPSRDGRLVCWTEPNGLGAEKFRMLAARLEYVLRERSTRSVQVTSSIMGEGKTLIAANVALALARQPNNKVLLLEGDLRDPMLSSYFGVSARAGLSDWWVQGATSVDPYLYRLDGTRLWFLPAGLHQEATELLQSSAVRELLAMMAKRFNWVVVDTPPMLPLADANLWARLVEGTIVVVRQGKTPRKLLEDGLQALDSPQLLGFVLNESSNSARTRYYGSSHRGEANVAIAADEVKKA